VILVHGVASSPEAWVNLANELLGDDDLRRHYQVWQVFYPTNLGMLASRQRIDQALRTTFAHFDPEGDDRASHDAVLVGHSMGGVIARLLVSDSGEYVLQRSLQSLPPAQAAALAQEPKVREMTVFHPLPEVGRAVFLAAPHRGAKISEGWAMRLVRRAIRLPFTVLRDSAELFQRNKIDEQELQRIGFHKGRPPTGPDDLSPGSLFMRGTADLPIEAGLPYHSIVGWRDPSVPLAQSSDGLVPYASAHLDGALSEKAIPSGHSVQETPAAILELRRILRLDMAADDQPAR
ncbi:MAG: esterase/lipase family protein, partial [Pseudoxanthomonas sp.]